MAFWRTSSPDLILFAAIAGVIVVWTATSYPLLSVALVIASLALAATSLWSCNTLLGLRNGRIFLAIGFVLGWLAEELGVTFGWFFGDYSYTSVLGPRLGSVPIVIPFMWFGLCYIGFLMACLVLWRQPAAPAPGWRAGALAALLAAMIVTAFDLAADPYFVFQLDAWIMAKKDGHWFGETVRGFEGWMLVSFVIIAAFQALARPAVVATATSATLTRRAALAPVLVYAAFIGFQVTQSQPLALRFIAFFAMGIPCLIALVAWSQWSGQPGGSTK